MLEFEMYDVFQFYFICNVPNELADWKFCVDGPQMTVVGVHSAKFDNEKDSGAIRNAVIRYDVTHPVT